MPLKYCAYALIFAGLILPAAAARAQVIDCHLVLDFGTLAACHAAGKVVVMPMGGYKINGCLTKFGRAPSHGSCFVIQPGQFPHEMQISVDDPVVTLSNGEGGTMVVDNFNLKTNQGGTSFFTTETRTHVDIGATLNVGAHQARGLYTGTFIVNVNYQ